MQRKVSLLVLVFMLLGLTVAYVWRATQAQEDVPPIMQLVPVLETPLAPDSLSPEDQKRIDEQIAAELAKGPGPEIVTAGESTRGITVVIADKQIKLPDNVQILGIIALSNCSGPCNERPAMVLENVDTGLGIVVGMKSGLVQDNTTDDSAKLIAQKRADFRWLIEAIGKEK